MAQGQQPSAIPPNAYQSGAGLAAVPGPSAVPAVSSPLNPDAASSKMKPFKPASREREPREKRDSFKKREAAAGGKGDVPSTAPASSKRKATGSALTAPSPVRYSLPPPRSAEFEPPREPTFASHESVPLVTPDGEVELKKPLDRAENKKGYRYTHCIADPHFRHKQFFRQTDAPPYGPRMSFEDTDKWMYYDTTGRYIANEKGWRMARANVCAREGSLFYEVRIVRGVPAQGSPLPSAAGPQPHVRVGWARREAPLDTPVGFDGFSYGITDKRFETTHRSRPGKMYEAKSKKPKVKGAAAAKTDTTQIEVSDDVREGDVIGLEITLPSLSLHRKVVSGVYNPAVDLGDGFDEDAATSVKNEPGADVYGVIRDRVPVPYKGSMFFETLDYVSGKAMDAYADRTLSLSSLSSVAAAGATNSIIKNTPNPNHIDPALRTLPHSSIRIYKNGQLMGTAFENLLAFLPPASAPSKGGAAREGFDDGMLGYFPAISCFSGGIAELNFGEHGFWMPPQHLKNTISGVSAAVGGQDVHMTDGHTADQVYRPGRTLRPMAEIFKEQVAEDIVWDIIDEVDFFMQDGGFEGKVGAGADGARRGVASLKEEVD